MTSFQQLKTTSADGTTIQLYRWNESGKINLFLVHGYASHAQRLNRFAESLAELGYRVTALDLRGHGQSMGARGEIDLWLRYTEDILAAIASIRAPFFAIAQGSGALSFLSTMQESITPKLQGVILANPLIGTIQKSSLVKTLLLRFLPRLPLSLKKQQGFRWDQLSFDHSINESYKNDPSCFSDTSIRFLNLMFAAQAHVRAYAQLYHYPLLMLISANDSIADPEITKDFYQQYAGRKQQKEFLRSAHLLLEDQEYLQAIDEIHTWISQQEKRGES